MHSKNVDVKCFSDTTAPLRVPDFALEVILYKSYVRLVLVTSNLTNNNELQARLYLPVVKPELNIPSYILVT